MSHRRIELERGLQNIATAGQGLLSVWIVGMDQLRQLVGMLDDGMMQVFVKGLETLADLLHDPSVEPGNAPICLTCNHEFIPFRTAPPVAFIITTAPTPRPDTGICNLLCEACYTHPNMRTRVLDTFRKHVFPDLQEITLHTAGHA